MRWKDAKLEDERRNEIKEQKLINMKYFFFCSVSGNRNPTEMATTTHSKRFIKLGRQYGNLVSSPCRNGSETYT